MCGIVGGFWSTPPVDLKKRMESALEAMHNRGPDDRGFELRCEVGGLIALGHTRLSIIDLSMAGHQPMLSKCQRYAIVFNGEIYNYRELRTQLREVGHAFATDSDTEVLLTAWIVWGRDCLRRLEGMFAFVIHDRAEHSMFCARDGFGIKPFFYTRSGDGFLFASSQKALLAIRSEKATLDWQRSYDYLVHGDYDSSGRTFIEGINHLQPGHYLEIKLATNCIGEPVCWWKPEISETCLLTFEDAAERVREAFLHNIRLHLRSDVTLGAALSGGIDSSAVVCAMRHVEPDARIKTFSYIAEGTDLSEEVWVDRINTYVNAESYKTTAGPEDLLRDLDDMILAQGEPFGSTSIYAQYRVFKLARQHDVTVTLDGQGADELLAGYSGYPGYRISSIVQSNGVFAAHRFAQAWSTWPGRSYRLAMLELGRIALPDSAYALARRMSGRNFRPDWLNLDMLQEAGVEFSESRPPRSPANKGRRVVEQLAKSLQERGLPALLRHADRNSMRFSVESRVPFLTPDFADLLLSMPESFLISDTGETKSIFRAAMRGIVPDEILDRRDKIGFATPEKNWLLALSSSLRPCLSRSNDLTPFLKNNSLLEAFDSIVEGRTPFSWQLWRWVNFIRWTELVLA